MLEIATLIKTIFHIERIFKFFVEYGFYFIERSGKYLYFMSGEATNEIYIFFTSQVKLKTYVTKTFEFSFLILYSTNLTKRGKFHYSQANSYF